MKLRALVLLIVSAAVLRATDYPPPPLTAVRPVIDRIQGIEFADPYRWLEQQDAAEVRQWLAAQNAYADVVLGRSSERAALRTTLRRLMDRPDIGRAQRGAGFEYFTLRRAGEEQAAIYRRPLPATRGESIDPSSQFELVVDPAKLSPGLTTALDVVAVTADGARLIYGVRDGGQDERELVVRDLKTMTDVERFPAALYDSVSLRKDDAGFFYVRRSRETGARVRFHQWGRPLANDDVLFGEGYGPTAFVSMAQNDDRSKFLFTVQHGWARSEVWIKDAASSAPPIAIVKDVDAHFYPRFVKQSVWMRTDFAAPMGRIVAVDPSAPGNRGSWRTVLPEQSDVLEDFALIGQRVYATYIRNASSRMVSFEATALEKASGATTPQSNEIDVADFTSASIRTEGDNAAILSLESFIAPETTYRLDLATGARKIEQAPAIAWDGSGYAVERIYGTSKDGTRVPIFVVGRKDRPRDGGGRVLLFGYGGFVAPQKPRFNALAAAWLESGGVYAQAVLRGGNEFGEMWHRGGMLTNKQRVFDDFVAAGEALVAAGITRPERLAIMGTSNGGLLVGAAVTQRPDLFAAVLCGYPDVDILRFNQHTKTNNMPALLEYGDAAIPEQFAAIRKYSPLQNVKPARYPAMMIWSGDLDTRVPPLAARKFTAALQAATTSGRPVILRYFEKGGHATNNGLPFSTRVDHAAAQLAFLGLALKN
jgi:prolyl oligopeptidase